MVGEPEEFHRSTVEERHPKPTCHESLAEGGFANLIPGNPQVPPLAGHQRVDFLLIKVSRA
jgi:hypothetical protein